MATSGRFGLFTLLAAVCARLSAGFSAAVAAVGEFALLAVRLVAEPAAFLWRTPALAVDGPAPSYDAPPAHFLRHEAGTSRRAAARHI